MLVIYQGSFGKEAAKILSQHQQNVSITDIAQFDPLMLSSQASTSYVVMLLGAIHPKKVKKIGDELWNHKIDHCAIYLTERFLFATHRVKPLESPCLNCSIIRNLTMGESSSQAKLEYSLRQFMETQDLDEIEGFLPSVPLLAALMAERKADPLCTASNLVECVSLNEGWTLRDNIIALHGCMCRQVRKKSIESSWTEDLLTDLSKENLI